MSGITLDVLPSEILTRPLTKKQMIERANEDNFINGVIKIDLDDIINNDFEDFLDIISEKLTGGPCLMDISYKVVGHEKENILFMRVFGDVSEAVENADDEDDSLCVDTYEIEINIQNNAETKIIPRSVTITGNDLVALIERISDTIIQNVPESGYYTINSLTTQNGEYYDSDEDSVYVDTVKKELIFE